MRESNRPPIDQVLAAIRAAWSAPGNENMRLGQLLLNAFRLQTPGLAADLVHHEVPADRFFDFLWQRYDERWIDGLTAVARMGYSRTDALLDD